MNPTTMNVQVFEWADVRGNKLMYLKVQYGGKDVLINIGEKTYKAIMEIAKGPIQHEIPGLEQNDKVTKIQIAPGQTPEEAMRAQKKGTL